MAVSQDAWISRLPFFQWPTSINNEVDDHLRVYDLLNVDGRGWRVQEITRLFDGSLADWTLTTPIPIFRSQDLRVWGRSCCPRIFLGDLSEMCRPVMDRRIEAA